MDSRAEHGVQLADLVAGALRAAWEWGDDSYLSVIRPRDGAIRILFKK